MRAASESQKVKKKLDHCAANRRCFLERYFRGRRTDRIGSGKRGRREGIEQKGWNIRNSWTSTDSDDGELWWPVGSGLDVYTCTGVEKSESRVHRGRLARARVCVCRAQDTPDFGAAGGWGGQYPWKAETRTPLAVDGALHPLARPILPRADNGGGSSLRLPSPQDARISRTISKRRMYVYVHIYVYTPIDEYIVSISPSLSSTRIDHLLFLRAEKISLLAPVHYRWMLEIVRSSISFWYWIPTARNYSRRAR